MMELHRDEEAVSAAIATVLLFGGVISIISLMMVTMISIGGIVPIEILACVLVQDVSTHFPSMV